MARPAAYSIYANRRGWARNIEYLESQYKLSLALVSIPLSDNGGSCCDDLTALLTASMPFAFSSADAENRSRSSITLGKRNISGMIPSDIASEQAPQLLDTPQSPHAALVQIMERSFHSLTSFYTEIFKALSTTAYEIKIYPDTAEAQFRALLPKISDARFTEFMGAGYPEIFSRYIYLFQEFSPLMPSRAQRSGRKPEWTGESKPGENGSVYNKSLFLKELLKNQEMLRRHLADYYLSVNNYILNAVSLPVFRTIPVSDLAYLEYRNLSALEPEKYYAIGQMLFSSSADLKMMSDEVLVSLITEVHKKMYSFAYEVLVRRHGESLLSFLMKRMNTGFNKVRDKSLFRETVHESFRKAFEYIRSYDHRRGRFTTWLYTITIRNHLKTITKKALPHTVSVTEISMRKIYPGYEEVLHPAPVPESFPHRNIPEEEKGLHAPNTEVITDELRFIFPGLTSADLDVIREIFTGGDLQVLIFRSCTECSWEEIIHLTQDARKPDALRQMFHRKISRLRLRLNHGNGAAGKKENL